ncbi:MAG: dihydrofolate reductase family protein [Spirochaetota bacterium]
MTKAFKMPFPADKIKLKRIYESEELAAFTKEFVTCPKVEQVYGRFSFPELPVDRVYTYGSFVVSIDGRIAFPESPDGTMIARKNFIDSDGGLCDYWILNLLRALSDAVLMGSLTIQREPELTGHIHDQELEEQRIRGGKPAVPLHVIVTRSGRNLPFRHRIITSPDIPTLIATSPRGKETIKGHLKLAHQDLGAFTTVEEITLEKLAGFDAPLGIIATGSGEQLNSKALLKALKLLGMNMLLIESPTFLMALMEEALLDELYLNTSSIFIGGKAPAIGERAPAFSLSQHPHAQVLTIHSHSDYFFYTRYRMRYKA